MIIPFPHIDPIQSPISSLLTELEKLKQYKQGILPQKGKTMNLPNINSNSTSANDGTVNTQITDSITQTSVMTLGSSAAVAMSRLYQAVSNSLAQSIQNASFAQQQSNMIHQAATTQGVNLIYAVDTASVGDATEKVARSSVI